MSDVNGINYHTHTGGGGWLEVVQSKRVVIANYSTRSLQQYSQKEGDGIGIKEAR